MIKKYVLLFVICFVSLCIQASQWIRVNQLGYLPGDRKVAVWMSDNDEKIDQFQVIHTLSGKVVYSGSAKLTGGYANFPSTGRLDFSDVVQQGAYQIKTGSTLSPVFYISPDVYDGSADFLLNYMRQQRCGYNPYLKDSCHQYDGRIIYHPQRTGDKIDVRGGWHDASDYLQYVTTTANAVFQLLFAYDKHPRSFGDYYDANGHVGANGIPDVLDEAKWGLDWLVRMNPDQDTFFNQLADDRDHTIFRLPTQDDVDYGWGAGKERPAYFCTGEKQGIMAHKNRATGLASTTGKFSSAYSLGARLLTPYYPEFSEQLTDKAVAAYKKGVEHPGVCQTAPCRAPYFYEEDNWTDDMQLAATQLYRITGNLDYLQQAVSYGRMEPVTPWMGADSARHYQWYPFLNMGHYFLGSCDDQRISSEFVRNLHSGLSRIQERAGGNAFQNGIPFIWCSNNLTVAALTQCALYREITSDSAFVEMEMALRDWLFGCNPWGKCMVVGLPSYGDYPRYPHSAFTQLHGFPIDGGLVDGPVYTSIFNNLKGIYLAKEDKYAPFQSGLVVYHDDYADYSTNEPTMDGTASLSYYLASQQAGKKEKQKENVRYVAGGVIQADTTQKTLTLVFTGDKYADGYETIRKTLKKQKIKGAFFLTGNFYRNHPAIIKQLQKDGHYLGPHSDRHLLYADWTNRDSTLVTRDEFMNDLNGNYTAMSEAGVNLVAPWYFMPSFEWYNNDISTWSRQAGVQVINFTPGTGSNADYTTPDMPSYRTSAEITENILRYEKEKGLNGFLLLTHIGTDERRIDKYYNHLDKLISVLKEKGYSFVSLNELFNDK